MPRIYAIETDSQTESGVETELTLVKADSQAQALNHVVKGKFRVSIASAMDVADYMSQGGTVEDATASKDPEAPPA